MAEAIPYCLMPGFEKYIAEDIMPPTQVRDAGFWVEDFTESKLKSGKLKFPQCKKCVHNSVCEGTWKEYPERMGSAEFSPVIRRP
jgi:hypothetical protein